ncbi:MAG TPA: prolyl oligopeptidase family serine peptidase [Bacteroidales bacterium]|nr:prolyl oligopeptidase family serine peptidase [Bacteroidales bacterium]
MTTIRVLTVILFSFSFLYSVAQAPVGYMVPPKAIVELVDAPATPAISIGPGNRTIRLAQSPELPRLEDLAAYEYRLAGIRFDPVTNGPSRVSYATGITFTDVNGQNSREVAGLPDNPKIRNMAWSPDGSKVAFTHTAETGIELWVADVATATARQLTGPIINDVMGNAFEWLSDNYTLVYSAVPVNRGEAPIPPRVASAPVIQENIGRRAAVRTFQDMLQNKYDEAIFDFYATSKLYKTNLSGNKTPLVEASVIANYSISPDGNFLMVNRVKRPYSYFVPYTRFPQVFEIYDMKGNLIRTLAEIPLVDALPQGFGAVRTGPRGFTWRADAPASLYWVEALDEGNPAQEVPFREQLFYLSAPFTGEPLPMVKLSLRFAGITWGRNDLALINEFWQRTRIGRTHAFHPTDASQPMRLIFERNMEDEYNNPGSFLTVTNTFGRSVLQFDRRGRKLFLFGPGASPEGNRPFFDEFDIETGTITRLWRSVSPFFESPVSLIDPERQIIITRRESVDQHPNFFIRDVRRNRLTQITNFPDPFPQMRAIRREMIHYSRNDGIPLTGTLFLPEGFRPGIDPPLPTILWAYPEEFKSADAAGQVTGSPYTYTRLGATSPVMLVTQGYAVLDNASFPVVGEGDKEPNDTFVQQLVANAEAAIKRLAEMGVTDPNRVGVSGHSYGAFMTANLLAHSKIFAAGVARSGAYNRTLTPFGFQSEERTYWQAPEVYDIMSPFMFADSITTPLLLIHGADDNNAGTFPMQSERFYDALRGHGATVRLVMLPHESHGYRARESILHMHWEWLQWFDRFVKNR